MTSKTVRERKPQISFINIEKWMKYLECTCVLRAEKMILVNNIPLKRTHCLIVHIVLKRAHCWLASYPGPTDKVHSSTSVFNRANIYVALNLQAIYCLTHRENASCNSLPQAYAGWLWLKVARTSPRKRNRNWIFRARKIVC